MGDMPAIKATQLVSGVQSPTDVVGLPDEPDLLWVIEHRTARADQSEARVRAVRVTGDTGMLLPERVAAFPVRSRANDEEGLHSIALHPDFVTNKTFYLFYSAAGNSATTIDEYKKTGPTSSMKVRMVFTAPSGGQYHNGGQIDFAPGDKENIYLSLGDNQSSAGDSVGGGGDSQNNNSPNGKIIKVNLMSGMWTMVHKGLRNPWRFSFDEQTGDMYIGDVGPGGANVEKLFFAKAGQTGINFGWGSGSRPAALRSFAANTQIIGGYVYRGKKMPGFCGRIIYGTRGGGGNFTTARVVDGMVMDSRPAGITNGSLSSFGQDAAGEIYFTDYSGGRVYRIDSM